MTTIALHPPTGLQPGARGPAVGLGISLLVHAAVLAWLVRMPATRAPDEAPVARMQVWLVPARPARPAPPEPVAAPAPAKPLAEVAAPTVTPKPPAARRQPHPRAAAPASAPARASEAPAVLSLPSTNAPDVFAVPPSAPSTPAAGPDAAPVVDLEAARQAARRIAREDARNLVTLPKRKPVVDPNQDRVVVDPIESARRSDCKTAYAGLGLLALIPLAKDAVTGTGCKW